MLLDSNIFIYAIQPEYVQLRQWCMQKEIYASDMTRLEVLGYHRLTPQDKQSLITLFTKTKTYPISKPIIELGIQLKQQRKMSVGDAIIAATALVHNQTLATRNVSDFSWIEQLEILNPLT